MRFQLRPILKAIWMLFSVDAHAIGRHLAGNEVYVRSLLEAFDAVDRSSEFIAYVSDRDAAGGIPRRFRAEFVSADPFVRLGYDLPRRIRADRPDLIHVQYTAPLFCAAPIVVSVHDVSFLHHPEYFTRARCAQLRLTVRRTVERAARIITDSEFSRRAIARAYSLDPDRIAVIPIAAAPGFRPIQRERAREYVKRAFGIAAPFIFNVGDLQPRKNQLGLVEAFASMLSSHPELKHHLVLAGQDRLGAASIRRAAEQSGFEERIHFTGFVSDGDLLQLYNACEFFVFPSFYEGFGMPVLEAMACGRAVACSNSSAVHEVADAAALLFDPHSKEEIVRAMLDLALDAELRARMERLGLQRAAQFSWKRTAESTLEIYREVAESRSVKARVRAAAGPVS